MSPSARMLVPVVAVVAGLLSVGAAQMPAARAGTTAGTDTFVFAPYVDLTQYPAPRIPAITGAAELRDVTLAFVTARGATACAPTWGGYAADPAAGPSAYERRGISAFQRRGGRAAISFGGQAGVELAAACPTVAELTRAYRSVIATYHPSRIDFDIEGAAVEDTAAIARRSQALAAVQRTARARGQHPGPAISLTLPVLPSGLPADALKVVRSAVTHHVTLTYVNLMTMDYGDAAAPHPAGAMAAYAIRAARSARRQLTRLFPHAGNRLIGITPMIGINDVATETFTLANARQLAAAARRDHYGLLSMWQLERDRQCPQPTTTTQDACSSLTQAPYAFSRAFARR